MEDPQQVIDAVAKHKPGKSLALSVQHWGEAKETAVTVTLGASPKDAGRHTSACRCAGCPAVPRIATGRARACGRRLPAEPADALRPGGEGLFSSIRWRLAASYALLILLSVTLMAALALYIVQRYVERQEGDA